MIFTCFPSPLGISLGPAALQPLPPLGAALFDGRPLFPPLPTGAETVGKAPFHGKSRISLQQKAGAVGADDFIRRVRGS